MTAPAELGPGTASGTVPWGVRRLAPYPTVTQLPYTTVTVDPATQLGVARDSTGQVVEMGKHGTSKAKETKTKTNSDSTPDEGHDQEGVPD